MDRNTTLLAIFTTPAISLWSSPYLIFLDCRIRNGSNILMHIEVEKLRVNKEGKLGLFDCVLQVQGEIFGRKV